MSTSIWRSPSIRFLLCVTTALFPVACTTYDAPERFENDPAARDARLVATLEQLENGAEICIVLTDGSEIRARYQGWHDEDEMLAKPVFPGWKAALLESVDGARVYRFEDIQYVARTRLTMLSKVGAGVMTVLGVIALIQMVTMPRDTEP